MKYFNKVKAFRQFAKLTQEEMSKLLGISIETYKNKEQMVNDFKASECMKLLEILRNRGRELNVDVLVDVEFEDLF